MSKIPFLNLREQTNQIRGDVDKVMARIIDNTSFVLGPELENFERDFASYCQTSYCVGTSSGTAAIHLALLGYRIGPGDEVITVPNTFIATAEAIAMTGAKPVLVDVREDTALIDPEKVKSAITPRTKAIIAVHLFGQCCDMDPLIELAEKKGLLVIEDSCQAHGATYKGRKAGSLGDAAAFSFYPSKNLGAFGEGGAVTTNDGELAGRIRGLRHHAQYVKNEHAEIGYNYRLDSLQAGILSVKLKYLDEWNEKRRLLADRYRENLEGTGYRLLLEKPGRTHVYHLLTVGCMDKKATQKALSEAEIGWGEHYPIPIHLQPAFSHLGLAEGSFPVAERLMKDSISLPMFPELKGVDVDRVCEVLRGINHS